MMLVMMLSTVNILSSCGGDDEDDDVISNPTNTDKEPTIENVITINGKSFKDITCTKSTRSGGGITVEFKFGYEDDKNGCGDIEFKFKELNPSGNVIAEKVEIEYEANDAIGSYYEGKPTNVPCNICMSGGKCSLQAKNINVVMNDNGKTLNASISINYNGNIYEK